MSGTELTASLRAAYLGLLEQQFGLRPGYQVDQASHLDGVVMQLLATSSYTQPAELYTALAGGLQPQMLEVLATSMTVGETHFFRVTPQMDALRRVVLPDLIARHKTDRRLRLWSAGCSTGEEPYTLAMLLCEQLPKLADWDIQLVATDLNRAALEVARLAVYGEWSFRDSPLDVRTRYFSPAAKRWRLNDRIRGMVRFDHLNLAEDPFPFASSGEGIDLILCRNVTIYFGAGATQHLYHRFAEAMEPAGWLLLGPSDPVPTPTSALEVVALDGALVWRRRQADSHLPPPRNTRAVPAKRPIAAKRPTVAARPSPPKRSATARPIEAPNPESPSMDPLFHLQAGMVRLGEGAPAAAIDSLRRAAFLDETSALVQFSLGTAYRQIGNPSRSRSAFSRARRLLAGQADDELLAGGEVATGELRHAVEAQLADLDRTRP
jgi:chemotaxis protein methyltransferase CheR